MPWRGFIFSAIDPTWTVWHFFPQTGGCSEGLGAFRFFFKYVCMVIIYSKSMDRPGKVANPARGQLNRENEYFPVRVRAWEFGLVRRVRQSRPASACSSPYSAWIWCLRDFSRFPQWRPILYLKRPDVIESVPGLSDHAIAHRWRSLPRVSRHRASKPLLIGSSERVLPFCRSPCTN